MSKWLNIKDYAIKSGLSISTLRRKIKEGSIKHKVEAGKYYIFIGEDINMTAEKPDFNDSRQDDIIKFAEKTISSINKLHQDLIEEKEKRLSIQDELVKQLKEEVVELRMLVKVLESNIKS